MPGRARNDGVDAGLSHDAAQLGLHRGRRVVLFLLATGALVWGVLGLWPPLSSPSTGARIASTQRPEVIPILRTPPSNHIRKPLFRAIGARAAPTKSVAALPVALIARPLPGGPERSPPQSAEPAFRASGPRAPELSAALVAQPEGSKTHAAESSPPPPPLPERGAPEAPPAAAESERTAVEAAEPSPSETASDSEPPPPLDGNGETIARGIAAEKRSAIQACFERELKRTPDLRGKVTVELDLAPGQRVDEVRVVDDLDRPSFTQCVAATMQHLTFVALNEEVSIQLPFILTSRAH